MPKVTRVGARDRRADGGSPFDSIRPMNLDDEGIKICLYGLPGSGKTTTWATFPDPILCLTCSGSKDDTRSGELRSIDTPGNRDRIDVVDIKKSEDILDICGDSRVEKYETLVLDNVSGLQELILAEILGVDKVGEQRSWGEVTQQQYGSRTAKLKDTVNPLLNFTGNSVIVAHQKEFRRDGDSELLVPYIGPALSPSEVGWLCRKIDFIIHLYTREEMTDTITKVGDKEIKTRAPTGGVEYCIRTGVDPTFMVKTRIPGGSDRSNVIIPRNVDTYAIIKDLITGRGGNDTDTGTAKTTKRKRRSRPAN